MVLNVIVAIGTGFVALYVVAIVARIVGGGALLTAALQSVTNIGLALLFLHLSMVGLPVAVAVAVMPILLRIFAVVWFYYIGKKVLAGDYGEESRWAAELVESGDEDFIEASTNLTQMELKEVGIVAANKEELRKIVVERSEEKTDE